MRRTLLFGVAAILSFVRVDRASGSPRVDPTRRPVWSCLLTLSHADSVTQRAEEASGTVRSSFFGSVRLRCTETKNYLLMQADSVTVADHGAVELWGRVCLRHGGTTITADSAQFASDKVQFEAHGHVKLQDRATGVAAASATVLINLQAADTVADAASRQSACP